MKSKLIALSVIFTLCVSNLHAQNDESITYYNMLKISLKSGEYKDALGHLDWCLENAPRLSVNIYKYGRELILKMSEKASCKEKKELIVLAKRLFDKRLENFPNNDPAETYSNYADFLLENGGDPEEIFKNYEILFQIDLSKFGIKSISYYIDRVIEKNKTDNLDKIFKVYDNSLESIESKVKYYMDFIENMKLQKENGKHFTPSQNEKLRTYTSNSKTLELVKNSIDKKVEYILTCKHMILLYEKNFDKKKMNVKWLKKSIHRMLKKNCTDDPLYEKLVSQYQEIELSSSSSILYAEVLINKGKIEKAISLLEKAIELETDLTEKLKILHKITIVFESKKAYSKAVFYAKKAIKIKPDCGKTYIVVANLYANSADDCGKDEFEKRMVYVAAKNYAIKAAAIDPTLRDYAMKLAKSYKSNQPNKKLIFNNKMGLKSGDSYQIKCWIHETVEIP